MKKKKGPGVVTITLEREELEQIFNGKLDRIPELQRKLTGATAKKSKNKGELNNEHKMPNTGN